MRLQITASTLARRIVLACTMLVALFVNVFGCSANAVDSMEKVWVAYTQAQRQLQQELANFFTSRHPDLKDLILLNRDLQLALIDRRSLEFRNPFSSHPDRILKDQGISRLANFSWTDDDLNALRHSSPEYEAVVKRVEELRKRSEGDSQWPALRAAQQVLAKDPEFQKIYERREERTQAAQKLLEGSRSR